MTPDQARAVANAVGEQLKNEWKTTSKVIAAVPNNKRDYKPDPNGRSAWELATHMAGADVWFLDGVINGKFDSPDEESDGCGFCRRGGVVRARSFPIGSTRRWRFRTRSSPKSSTSLA